MRDPRLYLEDMLAAARRVIDHAADRDRQALFADAKSRDAVLWNLLVLGEAAKNVPDDVRASNPAIEWRRIAGFRDVLAHGYFGLDEDIVWDVVSSKVPELIAPLEEALQRLEDGS